MSWVKALARADILALEAYEAAAWDPNLTRLHANELPWRMAGDNSRAGLNRYPEGQPKVLIERLARLYGVPVSSVLATRGSDDAIDLLIRAFCRAEHDAVLICPPTFGMYAVAARIQGAKVVNVPLRPHEGFALDEEALLKRSTAGVKIVFLCSPNNPTGNLLAPDAILRIAAALMQHALVVVDEAYVEFTTQATLARHLTQRPNLVILRTLSKAHALAGARCGTLIADAEVIALLRKVLPPYAIAQPTLEAVLGLLEPAELEASTFHRATICTERERMLRALPQLSRVMRVWPSEANFILAEFEDASDASSLARDANFLVRDVRAYPELPGSLRITIGTPAQNDRLLEAWA
jgi:histidinol-phosphate aminotransferase